ncbi:MAG: alpha/beta fold hydrolase, partial [Vicinamibacterales bacterium]
MMRDELAMVHECDPAGLTQLLVPVATGVTLNVVERPGDGTPVICLHGVWDWWRYWRPLVPAGPGSFEGRPLLMLDLRGHGDSSKPETGYTVADYAADVVA